MGEITRRPLARDDLIEIWTYIAEDNDRAADGMLDRIESVLRMLADQPQSGRLRPELSDNLRSFAVGTYVVFYRPTGKGIELVRVRSGYLDIGHDDFAN